MATREDKESAALSGETTPIAHLRPDIGDQPKRLVAGEVTITWPYSSVKKSIAFLLAEPDVRQRRVKGLVRVQLSGPSAKAVADCGIGGGDAITLSLDGVEWAQDDTPARPPGSRLEWQLKYSHKLVAEVKSGETGETKILKVDQPTDELTVPEPPAIDVPAIPETESQHEPGPDRTPATRATPRRAFDEVEPNEYESPAFIKRARTSYGALLDEDFDIFEDDGGRKGKGRKRPKYGRHSGMWRYTSASASPEPEVHEEPQETEQPTVIPAASSPGPRPEMMDEGCQTVELDLIPIPETQPIAASHSFAMPEAASPNKAREREYYSAPLANMGGIEAYSANQPSGVGIQTSPPQTAIPGPDLTATNPSLFSPFLPDGAGYGAPRFEAAVPGPSFGESQISLGDQVRFGFSHHPQPLYEQAPEAVAPVDDAGIGQEHDDYPESFLGHPHTANSSLPPESNGSLHPLPQPEHHYDTQAHGRSPSHEGETRDRAIPLWPISSKSMDPNQVAARIDVEAAGELAEEPHPVEDDLHSNGSEPETPEPEVTDEGAVEEQEQEVAEEPIYRQGGEELADAAADAEEDIDDGDEFEDDYLSGDHDEEYVADDRIGADYDMRNYADYEDDENDGSDDREHLGLVSDNEAIDEDESEDDDEEGSYDGEYDEDDDYGQYTAQPRSLLPSGPPPAKAAPVVIDLISDSEDEDEQKAPTPRQPQPPTIKRGTGEEGDEDEDEDEDEEGSENGEEDDSEEDELEEGSEDFEDDLTAEEGLVRDAAGDSESEDGNISGTVGSHNHAVGSRREEEEKAESVEGEVSEVSEPSELLDEEEEELLEDDEEEEELVVVEEKSVTKQVIVEASINQPQAAQALDEKGAEQAKEAQPEPEEGPTLQHHQQGNDAVTDEKQASAESDEAGPQSSSQLVSPIASQPEQAAEKERDHGDTPMSEVPQEAPPTEDQSPQLLEDPSMELDAEHEPVAEETRPSEEKDEDMADVQEAEPSVEGDQSMVDAQEIASTAERDESMADAQESRQSVEQDEDMASVRTVEPVAEDEDMASVHEPPREKDEDMADVQDVGPTAGHGPEIPTEDVLIERRDAPVAPSSPPLTQEQFETQAVEKDLYISTAIERPSQEDVQEAGQLLTPLETQTSEALVHATESVVEEQDETQDTPEVLHEAILPSTSAVAPSAVEHAELAKEAAEPAAASPKLGETPASERAVEPPVEHVDLPEAVTQQVDEPNSKGLHGEVTDARTTAEGDNTLSDEPDLEARSTGEPDLAHNLSAEKAETPTRHQIEESHLEESAQPEQTNMETPAVSSPRLGQEEKPDQPIASQPTQDAITVAVGGEASLKSLAHISSSPGTAHLPDDPSIQLARAALPPKRGKRTLAPTQEVPRTTRATSKSLQREPESDEDTSVQLAKAAINSPTKKGRELDGTATQMKLELTKRLRTEMPDCVTLKTLRSHLNKNLDAAVVATTQPPDAQRAKGGPRQYMMSFNVTDPSVAPMHVVEVQFYRAHKDYLPVVKPGDAILLRGFTVVALKDKGFGLRTHDASSWAVFDREDGLAQIRGPPVELSDEEVAYLTDLRKWYGALGEPAKAKLDKANQKFAEVNHAK